MKAMPQIRFIKKKKQYPAQTLGEGCEAAKLLQILVVYFVISTLNPKRLVFKSICRFSILVFFSIMAKRSGWLWHYRREVPV
jgi:hypothetical protein